MDLVFRIGRWFCQIILFTCTFNVLHAQDYRMKRFGVSEGLPSSEVYCVMQDRQGYMWLGTDRGAVRYDGYRFKVFSTDEGLPDNAVFEIYEDQEGKIWFACFSSRLTWYSEGAIHDYPYNYVFEQAEVGSSVKTDLTVAPDGSVYVGTYHHGMLVVNAEGELHAEGHLDKGAAVPRNGQYVVSLIGRYRAVPSSTPPLDLPSDKNFFIDLGEGRGHVLVRVSQGRLIAQADVVRTGDSTLVVGVGNMLYYFREKVQTAAIALPGSVTKVHLDEKNRIWVGIMKGGLKVFDLQGNPLPIQMSQLEGTTVSDIMEDHTGSFWFTTTQQGLFFLPSLDFPFLPISQTDAYHFSDLVSANDSFAFFSLENKGFYSLSTGINRTWEIEKRGGTLFDDINLAWEQKTQTLWLSSHQFYSYHKGKLTRVPNSEYSWGSKSFYMDPNRIFRVGGPRGVFSFDKETNTWIDTLFSNSYVWSMNSDRHGQLWLGTNAGLLRKGFPEDVSDNILLGKRVTAIGILPDDQLAVGTLGAGIVIRGQDSSTFIGAAEGLNTNHINCLSVDRDGVIWAGSGKGLHRISRLEDGSLVVKNFGQGSGMPFLEVHRISTSPNVVWAAGPEGILVADRHLADDSTAIPPVLLNSVKVNGRDTSFTGKLELDYRQNDIRFSYLGIHYRSQGLVTYRYRLSGLDKDWRYTRDTVVSYPGLAPGSYQFEVAAGNSSGQWSESPVKVDLEIVPAFFQRWWFTPLLVVLIVAFLGGIALYFNRQWRIRVEGEKRLEEWKMKALRARMDPHFTFNTLNTIQAYITTHDTLSAEKYLNKFSRLVRLVLHQSDTEYIALSEEVELLVLYLELEQMRFGGRFEFEISVDPSLDRELTCIPGMLVQPLAENAIKHGLLPRKGGGMIWISFNPEGDRIRCTVRDNGIGREAARRLREGRTDQHRSAGLDLVRSRLQLLGKGHPEQELVAIVDLKDENGVAAGTEISFSIPLNQKI